MKHSSIALSAATLMSLATLGVTQPRASRPARKVRNKAVAIGRYTPRGRGARYPEQSSRQELRGYRRAQGGPGLVLQGGEYYPRTGYPEASGF